MAIPVVEPPKTLECGFCKSTLSRRGEVIKLGAEAVEYRDAPEETKKLRKQIDAHEARIAELQAEVARLTSGDDDEDDEDDWD